LVTISQVFINLAKEKEKYVNVRSFYGKPGNINAHTIHMFLQKDGTLKLMPRAILAQLIVYMQSDLILNRIFWVGSGWFKI